jgi:hypothetical protein
MVIASHCVGFTLPGMIEEPGSFSGRTISPRPERGPERLACEARQLACKRAVEAAWRIQPGADRGTALGDEVERRQGDLEPSDAVRHLLGVAGEFLAEGDRRRVLQMGAADLDHAGEAPRLRADAPAKPRHRS